MFVKNYLKNVKKALTNEKHGCRIVDTRARAEKEGEINMTGIYVSERTIEKGTAEYKRFEAVAKMLSAFSKSGFDFKVEDVYLDYGQDWMWTTITTYHDSWNVQVLSPRQWMAIMTSETMDDLMEVIKDIRNGEYFED